MKRRNFLKTTLTVSTLTGVSAATLSAAAAQPAGSKQEYYELRAYRLKSGAKCDLLDAYLQKAAIPAWNRLGIKNVGAFKEKQPKDAPSVFVLMPYATLEEFAAAAVRLNGDAEYQQAGAEYLQSPKTNPAFERIDSWLLLAFAGMPQMELPAYCRERKPRLFELRTYESHSEAKAIKKVEMFNSGEIDVMHEVGLAPIFYGQALIGPNLPHLTYMTSGETDELHKKHWDGFGKHPTWTRLKDDPQYADTVSKITKWILEPATYSQI
jgi:hypothetical protein